MLFPIDLEKNTKRIMNGEGFRSKKNHIKELVRSCQWMRANGYTEDEIKQFVINNCCDTDLYGDCIARRVGKIIERSKKSNEPLYPPKPITFYQSEIDWICGLDTKLWIKRYAFLVIGAARSYKDGMFPYSKTDYIPKDDSFESWEYETTNRQMEMAEEDGDEYYGGNKSTYNNARFNAEFLAASGLQLNSGRGEDYNQVFDLLTSLGVAEKKVFEPKSWFAEAKTNTKYKFTLPVKKSGQKFVFEDVYEMEDKIDIIGNFRVCPKCGKRFDAGSQGQTELCDECYDEERRKVKGRIGESECVCKRCGDRFVKGGRGQTGFCQKCYDEERRKFNGRIGESECFCKRCGEKFIKNGRGQTDLCVKCYKIKRTADKHKSRKSKNP